MLWGRTIGEWAVGIAVYTLITAVVLSLLVLDFVIVRYDVMALLIQALSGSEIVGSVSRLLFVLGQIWVIILSIRIPPSFWEKRLAVLPFQADPDNSALALCIGLASGAFLLVIVALWMPEDLPGVPEFWNAQVCMDSIFGVGLPWSKPVIFTVSSKGYTIIRRNGMLKLNEQADEFLGHCPTWVSIRNDHHRGLLLIERYHPGMQDIVNRLDREAGIRHPADKETEIERGGNTKSWHAGCHATPADGSHGRNRSEPGPRPTRCSNRCATAGLNHSRSIRPRSAGG